MKLNVIKSLILVGAVAAVVSGCSQQWREVNPGATPEEIDQILDRMVNGPGLLGVDPTIVNQLKNDAETIVFFKRSEGLVVPPEVVMSLSDVSPFVNGVPIQDVFSLGLQGATVIVLDGFANTSFGRDRFFVLLIEMIQADGTPTYFSTMSQPGEFLFDSGEDLFEVAFTGVNGEALTLQTRDLSDDNDNELATNVKFKVFVDEAGQRFPLGQFSALAGIRVGP
jgi:hypothetical protein